MFLPFNKGDFMEDPFRNRIAPRVRMTSKYAKAPTKEEATTGRYMQFGDYYGVGFNQPVGKEKAGPGHAVPQKCKNKDPNTVF